MSHDVHHTNAFVLSKVPSRDADAILSFMTELYGKLDAVAISVREERSKLRYALQPGAHVRIALVQGRELWRVTGAEILQEHPLSGKQKYVFLQLLELLRRLVHGEGHHEELYPLLCNAVERLSTPGCSPEEAEALERIAVLRICSILGYAGSNASLATYLSSADYSDELLKASHTQKALLISHINESLHASHL